VGNCSDGLWLRLLSEDNGHTGSNAGGVAEGELTANFSPCHSFSGNYINALEIHYGYFQGVHLLVLFPHPFRRAELTVHLRTEATRLRKSLQLSLYFLGHKSQNAFEKERTLSSSRFLKHKLSLNMRVFLLRIWD